MKTYLTLLFCAPLVLYILGAMIMDADAENVPVPGTATTTQTTGRNTDSVPLLVRAGTHGWAGTSMNASDSMHISTTGHIAKQ